VPNLRQPGAFEGVSSRIKEDTDVKKLLTSVCVAATALAVPAGAMAKQHPHPTKAQKADAKQYCQQLRKSAGKQNFREMFGTGKNHVNAMRNCKRSQSQELARDAKKAAKQAKTNAAKQCKAERQADPSGFKDQYGTGKNGKNAYGKCVSQHAKQNRQEAKAQEDQEQETEVNAAATCKAERKDDPAAFNDKYGKNGNKRNAFGKCVSSTAKKQEQEQGQQQS
jgi:hypothetical protein